jgi:5-methylcytosine-specific restriction endonuclease McrA
MHLLHHHYVHPSQENPALWAVMRAQCWRQWGEHCLYRSPALGIKCDRTWDDPVPWHLLKPKTWSGKTRMNADHIYPAFTYPRKRWDQDNLQTICEYHNKKKGIRGHIDYRPGHYHRGTEVTKWWLLLPFRLLIWVFTWLARQR